MFNKWLKLFPGATRNKADFLLDGEAYYESVITAIETAKTQGHYIYILGWMLDIDLILANGRPEKTLFKLLEKASKNNVEIRILIWDNLIPGYYDKHADAIPRLNKLQNTSVFVDSHTFFPQASKDEIQKITPYLVEYLQRFGGKLLAAENEANESDFFTKKILKLVGADINRDTPVAYAIYRLLELITFKTIGSHHEKVVIVKGDNGLISFAGGIDFNKNRVITTIKKKEYRFPYYHDNACRVEGPAAFDVLTKFLLRWKNHPSAKSVTLLGSNESRPKERPAPYPYVKVVGTYNSPNGSDPDRSLRKAYLSIIENASSYIYIEDQYLVNLDVAKALNKKIREPGFQKLTFAIQDSGETADIFIPNRKRAEFISTIFDGASDNQKEKVLIALLDKSHWEKERYHPGMHAKTLIVDDEIAIIGSANVNQRSFTVDSETSIVVFNDIAETDKRVSGNFARNLRAATWKEFLKGSKNKSDYDSWWNFPNSISTEASNYAILKKYAQDSQPDLDVKINSFVKSNSVVTAIVIYEISGQDLSTTSAALSPFTVKYVFDQLWQHIIDPQAP